MLCVAFASPDICYAGTLSGDIYVWRGNNLQKVIQDAHGVSTLMPNTHRVSRFMYDAYMKQIHARYLWCN